MKKRIHIVHHSTGRIRAKVAGLKGNHELAVEIHEVAGAVEGVELVRASAITGSVVVYYDKTDPLIRHRLEAMLDDANRIISLAVPEVREAETVVDVVNAGSRVFSRQSDFVGKGAAVYSAADARIKAATDNAIDLKTLFPVALAASGMVFWGWKITPLLLTALLIVPAHSLVTRRAPAVPDAQPPPA